MFLLNCFPICLLGIFHFSTNAQYIFHGTSIILQPNITSRWPGDGTFTAANFYCYFTPTGYVSFGWWLPATPGANHSHCNPHSLNYDWYEYTTAANCTERGCRVHAVNFPNSNTEQPDFAEDYVLSALDLGNGALGALGLSYFDKEGGAYAVGTRRILNNENAGETWAGDCHAALGVFQKLRQKRDLVLPFALTDVCPPTGKGEGQLVLGNLA